MRATFEIQRELHLNLGKFKYVIAAVAAVVAVGAFASGRLDLGGAFRELIWGCMGIGSLWAGFSALRKKRMMENVPSSRVRSVAMGLAELNGVVRRKTELSAPLTGTRCCYYRYTIEKYTGGKNSKWSVVERGASTEPFFLEDPTGRILVAPDGAEVILRTAWREERREGGIFGQRRRFTEWRLADGQRAYVIGSVRKQRDVIQEGRLLLQDRLRSLKQDPQALAAHDTDRDGRLDAHEWDGAVASVKRDLLRQDAARGTTAPEDDLVVGKGTEGGDDAFVIADRPEKHVTRFMRMQMAGGFALGVFLSLLATVSLLARAGILPRAFIID